MGIGMIIGGALQGLGNGITMKGQSDIAQAREQALERLRSANNIAEINARGDVEDSNNARKAKRDAFYDTELAKTKGDIQVTVDTVRGKIAGDNATKLETLRQTNRVALEGLQNKNTLTRDAINFARETDRRAQEAGTYIDRYETRADGTLVGITKTGKIYSSNIKLMPKTGLGDDLLSPGSVAATGNPKTPAPPATPPPAPSPTLPPNYSSLDDPDLADIRDQSYSNGGGFGNGTAALAADVAATTNMTYTMADLAALKREGKMTDVQARAWFAARGYKLATK